MAQERSGGLSDGIRTGIGVLTAFKDAIEETINEAIARGDLSPERAKGVVRDAADRIQSSLEDVRERLDVVSRQEFDALRAETDALRLRIEALEATAPPARLIGGEGAVSEIPVD
jgi:polyhydroxyalkanoate synthesis regulator phasin